MQVLDAPLLQPLRNRTTAPDRLIGWWSTQGLPLGIDLDCAGSSCGSISLTRAGTLLPNSEVSICETEQRVQEMPCVYIGDTANLLTRSLVLQWLWSGRNGIITTKIFCGMLPDVLHTVIRRHLLQPGNHGSAGHLAYMPAV